MAGVKWNLQQSKNLLPITTNDFLCLKLNWVEQGNWVLLTELITFIGHHKELKSWIFLALALRSDKGLALETSAFKLFTGPIYIIYSMDSNTKLLCSTLPQILHHSFFINLPLCSTEYNLVVTRYIAILKITLYVHLSLFIFIEFFHL